MNTANPTEIWWPHPSALDDLTVEETEDGFTLSAPDDTECADWLTYFNETDERREVFARELLAMLEKHANQALETHGKDEKLADRIDEDGGETEENITGSEPEHEPGSNP